MINTLKSLKTRLWYFQAGCAAEAMKSLFLMVMEGTVAERPVEVFQAPLIEPT